MTLTIRTRLTIWYASLVMLILVVVCFGIVLSARWGLRHAADQELTSGIDGVAAFLNHKLGMNDMGNLNEELREHSSLLPRGKMFRVTRPDRTVVYQPDMMAVVPPIVPDPDNLRKESIEAKGRSYRTISRFAKVGPYLFLIQVAVDQTEYQELTTGLLWILLLSVPVAGLLSALAGYWMSGRVLSPIDQITKTTNSIDARSLSRRLPLLGTNDELDQLSITINRMLDRIATSYERIEQFTGDASHELRTPVALIRSNAELLLMLGDIQPNVRNGLADIIAESAYMTGLIGDLLTLARGAEEGKASPMELIELAEPVRSILDRARSLASTRDITVEYAPLSQIVPIRGNQAMIERVLMILIDNAIRYTPPHGRIQLETWVSEKGCGFLVSDNGIGIAPGDQNKIFERFFRVDAARTHGDGGYGLGLSIAKSLVDFHRGSIQVESELGQGSTFRIGFERGDVTRQLPVYQ
ncbi:sensor histidine kinase [Silvibacterium acidisoli]|uniref:sensor histidine kinase n=1 Tax=Acidobacteriaceae bacterium ZG23-2 TaxID=2883246 RepID=UPI00406D1101